MKKRMAEIPKDMPQDRYQVCQKETLPEGFRKAIFVDGWWDWCGCDHDAAPFYGAGVTIISGKCMYLMDAETEIRASDVIVLELVSPKENYWRIVDEN